LLNILAFFSHPDDETMFCGGTLALLARQGVKVHYVCATRGEGGEVGDPPLCSPEDLGRLRAQELACAVEALGGSGLEFLEYLDPNIGPEESLYPYADDLDEVSGKLVEVIRRVQPKAVITHGANGEYGHPAHLLSYHAAHQAVLSLDGGGPALYCVSAAFPGHPKPRHINRDQPAHLVLDVTPVMEQKIRAAYCHRTQNALFVRRASQNAGRPVSVPEVLLKLESLHRAWPVYQPKTDDLLVRLLSAWMIDPQDLAKTAEQQ
jgi:LmbE family N-acetylglucosaminyl deacetylase